MATVKIKPLVTISSIAKLWIALLQAESSDPSLLLTVAGSAVDLSSGIDITKKPNMLNDFRTLLRQSIYSTLNEHEFVFEEDQIDQIIDTIFSVERLQDYLGENAIDLLRENFIAALDKLDYLYKEHDLDVDQVLELILEKIHTAIHQNPDLAALDTNINVRLLVKMLKEHMQGGHAAERFPKYLTGLEPFQQEDILHRETDIAALTEKLASVEKRVLISGIGGVGKTLLARAVCEAMDEHFKHIAWLHYDGNLDAQLLKLDLWPQNSDLNTRLTQIKVFLKNVEEPVLIIIDNIEDRPSRETLSTLNSFSPSVRLLLTSRLPRIRGVEAYPLEFLSLDECVDVFYAAYTRDVDRKHREVVEKMITSVSRHTLTVELLALSAQGDADTLPDVWRKLQDAGFAYSNLEVENFHEPDPQTIKEHIRRLYDLAGMDEDKRKILRVFSILPHSSPIPMKIIDWMPCDNNDLRWLVGRGWLQQAGNDLYLHQMIQESVRLQEAPGVEDLRGLMASFSTEEFIPGDMDYTESATRLGLSEALFGWLEPKLDDVEFALLMSYTGNVFHYKMANYSKALIYHRKALVIREKVLGSKHPLTAATYHCLAGIYETKGDYHHALEYYKLALELSEEVLGTETRGTAATYHNLGGVYYLQKDYPQAVTYYRQALDTLEKVLGSENPDIATAYNNLGVVFQTQKDYHQALDYYQKALKIRVKLFGYEHPDTATTLNDLAVIFRKMEHYPTALDFHKRALKIIEKAFGCDHPRTANIYEKLALLYQAQADYPLALELFHKSYLIFYFRLGAEHPDTITVKRNLEAAFEQANICPEPFDVWLQEQLEQHNSAAGGLKDDIPTI